MTIIQAVQTGKLFKRPINIYWMKANGSGFIRCWDEEYDSEVVPDGFWNPQAEDILADDWEIKP